MRKVNTIKIGKNIQAIRKGNGYTQERLAEKKKNIEGSLPNEEICRIV